MKKAGRWNGLLNPILRYNLTPTLAWAHTPLRGGAWLGMKKAGRWNGLLNPILRHNLTPALAWAHTPLRGSNYLSRTMRFVKLRLPALMR
jgi:hypothetical protein